MNFSPSRGWAFARSSHGASMPLLLEVMPTVGGAMTIVGLTICGFTAIRVFARAGLEARITAKLKLPSLPTRERGPASAAGADPVRAHPAGATLQYDKDCIFSCGSPGPRAVPRWFNGRL